MAFLVKTYKKEAEIIKNLEKIALKLNFKIYNGKLNFAGLNLKGGTCTFYNNKHLIFNRNMNFENKLEIFRQAFQEKNFNISNLNEAELTLIAKYITSCVNS